MQIRIDPSTLAEALSRVAHIERGAQKVLKRTLDKTARKARTDASYAIRQELALKKAYVDEKIRVYTASAERLESRISAEKRGVLMTRYTYTVLKKGRGISVKIKPGRPPKKLPGAFVVPSMRFSHVPGIAIRTGPGKGGIDVLHSPSVSQALNVMKDDLQPELEKFMARTLKHEADYLVIKSMAPD